MFKTSFWLQNHLLNFYSWIHKDYFVVKKLVFDICVKNLVFSKNDLFDKCSLDLEIR